MNGWNQKSNALQSLLGLGISVSADTINMAVQSLSKESHNSLQRLRRSLLASYAYDNQTPYFRVVVPACSWSHAE